MGTGNLKYFNGKVANVVGYQSYGKQRLRSLPARIHQTLATRQSGRLFGRASGIGAAIRHRLVQIIPYPSDIKMQTRLTSSIYKWLKENTATVPFDSDHLPFIEGYQFTDDGYTLSQRFRLNMQTAHPVEGLVQIHVPAFVPVQSITAPAGTISLECHVAAVNCSMDDPGKSEYSATAFTFSYNDQLVDAQTISLKLPTPPGSLLITVASLKYLVETNNGLQPSRLKGFTPAAIISAMSL
jgi:hypothetical protein